MRKYIHINCCDTKFKQLVSVYLTPQTDLDAPLQILPSRLSSLPSFNRQTLNFSRTSRKEKGSDSGAVICHHGCNAPSIALFYCFPSKLCFRGWLYDIRADQYERVRLNRLVERAFNTWNKKCSLNTIAKDLVRTACG